MKTKWKTLLKCIAVPLLTGALSALLSGGGMRVFAQLRQPPLSPPGWLFPVVWTILYILMGIASYLVCTSDSGEQEVVRALRVYFYQLLANFLWPVFFFSFRRYFFAFLWLVLLWGLIVIMIKQFYAISETAAYLLVPYLAWVTFAGYLNLAIWLLN